MASQTLTNDADHDSRVRSAENIASIADRTRGDFKSIRSALKSLEGYLQDFWRILNLDPAIKESLDALILEQRVQCEVIDLALDNLVSRYDRYLNLVTYLRPHSNESLLKIGTVAELHQYTDGRRDEECVRAKCQDDRRDERTRNEEC